MPQELINRAVLVKRGGTQKTPVSPDLFRSFGGVLVALVFLGGVLLGGCGTGRKASMSPQQVVAQVDAQAKQNSFQEQLMELVPRPSAIDSQNYKIGSEDLLEVNFLDTEKLRREVRVNGDGEISLLLVGTVPVAGLTTTEVEKKLTDLYRQGDYLRLQ